MAATVADTGLYGSGAGAGVAVLQADAGLSPEGRGRISKSVPGLERERKRGLSPIVRGMFISEFASYMSESSSQ